MLDLVCAVAFCIFAEPRIVDGDTFDVWWHRYRLWGADTPERGQPGFHEATAALAALTEGGFACRNAQASRAQGRPVVQCWNARGEDFSCELIRQGHAVELIEFSGGAFAHCHPPMVATPRPRPDRGKDN